ncbi:putative RND superfamily exporter [Thermoplasmatales archaeon SCGC AB-539-N05]|nr:putative RND superfamily exporter [Thermoplasmatales archaeon SCGC AB-539-N05]
MGLSLRLANVLVRKPKTVFLLFTILTLAVGSQAINIHMESDMSIFLPTDEPVVELLDIIQEEWPVGFSIIIYVEADDVTSYHTLKDMEYVESKLNGYKNDAGSVDGVFSTTSVVSMIKKFNSESPPIGKGKNEIPDDERLIDKYIAQMGDIRWSLITRDKKDAAIVVQLVEKADHDRILTLAEEAIRNVDTKMMITGMLPINKAIETRSMQYMMIIFPIAAVIVVLVLFFFHRSLKSVLIAFLPPFYSIIITFGVLGVVQPQLTALSIAVIALLVGLGVDYSLHLMNRFIEERSVENLVLRAEKTLRFTGKAVFLSTITTMIGFGSLMISSMPPIVTFGFACVIGILFCFISSCILVPCLVLMLKFEKMGRIPGWQRIAKFATENKFRIIAFVCIITAFSLVSIPYVKTDVDYMVMAPQDEPYIQAMYEYSEKFGSSGSFNVVLVEADVTNPKVINAIKSVQDKLKEKGISSYSIADLLKFFKREAGIRFTLNNILDSDEKAFMLNKDYSKTLIMIYMPVDLSMDEKEQLINMVNQIVLSADIPSGTIYQITGSDVIEVAINNRLMNEQTKSLIFALVLISIALIIIFKSCTYGLITLIPVFFILAWEPATLVFSDIPLSVITISIASIMIGTGIDYGIHITQRLREGLALGLTKKQAIETAVNKTGVSLVEAASTTIGALIAVFFVNVPGIQQFSIIIILMILFSCVGAIFILPAVYMAVLKHKSS